MPTSILALKRSAEASAGNLTALHELCRRAGLPAVTTSPDFTRKILAGCSGPDPLDSLVLYDLVWSVRGAIRGLIPCGHRRHAGGDRYEVEFWSLQHGGEVELQQVVADVSATQDGRQRLHLSLPDEFTDSGDDRHLVLVVEDDAGIAEIEQMLLERAGFAVVVTGSLEAGWEAIRKERPSAVVLDLDLPDGSGADLCRRLKEDPRTKHIPVIICSGNAGASDVAARVSAEVFLAKPEEVTQVASRVRQVLGL